MAADPQFVCWLRGMLWSSLVGLYGITVVVCGIVIPLSDFLSGVRPINGSSIPFQIYTCLLSAIFMGYLEIYTFVYIRRKTKTHGALAHRQAGLTSGAVEEVDEKDVFIPQFAYVSEGVNFYMRLGALVFGLGALILEALLLYRFRENYDKMMSCYGHRYILMAACQILFYLLEFLLIFRQHRLVINFHKEVVKLGLVHLMATNISIWAFSVIFEAAHSVSHGAGHGDDHSPVEGHHSNHTVTTADPHHSPVSMSHDSADHSEVNMAVECSQGEFLFSESSPYLFPLIIEFVLIGVTVVYKIYTNVGATINPDFLQIMMDRKKEEKEDAKTCRKWNFGIIIGVILLVCAIVSTVYFNILEEASVSSLGDIDTIYIYYMSDNVAQFLAAVLVILCFWKTSKLYFHGHAESQLDQNLLLITLFGLLLLDTLMIISAAHALPQAAGNHVATTFTKMQITLSVLTMVQSCTQVAFIFDAMRRCSSTDEDRMTKPGRIFITILLLLNLAMWVVNTFQFKEVQQARTFTEYFGSMAWSIIFNMALPLAIFFRFHSSVCLSDVVLTLYHKYKDVSVKGCERIERDEEIF